MGVEQGSDEQHGAFFEGMTSQAPVQTDVPPMAPPGDPASRPPSAPPPAPPSAAPSAPLPAPPANPASIHLTLFFAASLLPMLALSQIRTPRVMVLVVLTVYVVVATLWTRSQYVESLDGQLTVPTRFLIRLLCVGGAAAALVGAVLGSLREKDLPWILGWAESIARSDWPGTLLVGGVIAVYLGIGFVIVRRRARIGVAWDLANASGTPLGAGEVTRSALVRRIVVMLITLVIGLALLGRAPVVIPVVLIVAAVVGFPYNLSLLSEHAIRGVAASGTDLRWRRLVAGLALVAIGVGVGRALGGTWVPAVALLLLALLVLAISSSTLADIAVVLAAVALLGVTPTQDRPLAAVPPAPAPVLVALGDSYMSGEGASTFIRGTDEGGGNECRRASTAWAVLAGQTRFRGLVFLACSGADSFNIRDEELDSWSPEPEAQPGEGLTQLARWRATYAEKVPDPALVVVSAGGNDAGFSKIGLTCLAPGDCNDEEPEALWGKGNLDRVENRLRQTYAQVREQFGTSPVAVIPYPDPVAKADGCPQADLSSGDIAFIRTFLIELNKRIAAAAADYGFHYVAPMVTALADQNLQLCDPANNGRPGLNFIGIRSVSGLAEQRFNPTKWHHNSLHPNERGHAAMNVAFQVWLDEQGGVAGLEDPAGLQPAVGGAGPIDEIYPGGFEGCAAFAVDDADGCQKQSVAWALRSTGWFALTHGILALLVMLGAWLAGVTFFGWRRAVAGVSP